MKILLLAPQPFYTERGTPIAVRLAAAALTRAGHTVDLLCYHEGEDVALDGLALHRIAPPRFVRGVPIGLSWKKLVCDLWLAQAAWRLLRSGRHDVVHAVEESAFIALLLRALFRFRLVYDMDSIMASQITEKWPALKPFARLLHSFERMAARRADTVVAVCPSIADFAHAAGAVRVHLLPDVAFPVPPGVLPAAAASAEDLRSLFPRSGLLLVYVGNLERYQGLDLLLEALVAPTVAAHCNLAVIGGNEAAVQRYRAKVAALGIAHCVRFTGPRPLALLPRLLQQADILCSPRLAGVNTPMKIYSYMAAGRAILATDIPAHTQVLDARCAQLVPPQSAAMSAGLLRLAADSGLRARLGQCARAMAGEQYSFAAYERRIIAVYAGLQAPAAPEQPLAGVGGRG
jgi:glycosyltransferase involved in cell wall biosynthesis